MIAEAELVVLVVLVVLAQGTVPRSSNCQGSHILTCDTMRTPPCPSGYTTTLRQAVAVATPAISNSCMMHLNQPCLNFATFAPDLKETVLGF